MSKPVSADDNNFDQMVLKADKPVLVDLWAEWCKPCQMVAPILDELAGEYDGRIDFVKVDVSQNPKTATRYGVTNLPTLLVFKKGEPIAHLAGLKNKPELKRSLDAALA